MAIVVITLAGGCLVPMLFRSTMFWPAILGYTAGGILVAGVSLADDLKSLSTRVRFAAQNLGGLLAIWGAGYYSSVTIPFGGEIELGWIGLPITLLWIAGLINSYNFMDGIDGIAGGQAVVAGIAWALLGWLGKQPMVSALGLLLATSSLGFLGHNWPSARIFMGDVGSAFLGYTFAILPLFAVQDDPRLALAGVLVVWPFVFDTVFTFLRRLHNGENVFSAHRSHLYQRLVIAGHSHRFVTLLYIGLAGIGAILALSWSQNIPRSELFIVLGMPVLSFVLWTFVIRQERLREFENRRLRV